MLLVSGSQLKVVTRDETGNIGLSHNWLSSSEKEGFVLLHIVKDDALFLLKYSCWDHLFARFSSQEVERVVEFVESMSQAEPFFQGDKVSLSFEFKYTIAKVVLDILLH